VLNPHIGAPAEVSLPDGIGEDHDVVAPGRSSSARKSRPSYARAEERERSPPNIGAGDAVFAEPFRMKSGYESIAAMFPKEWLCSRQS